MSENEAWYEERESLRQRVSGLPEKFFPTQRPEGTLRVRLAALEEAKIVHTVMQAAFGSEEVNLDPPSGALSETVEETAKAMQEGGALLGWIGEEAVASARFRLEPGLLYVGRLGVLPEYQGQGIGRALMQQIEAVARLAERPKLRLGTRMRLEQNVAFYRKLGYEVVEAHPHPRGTDIIGWLEKTLPVREEPLR